MLREALVGAAAGAVGTVALNAVTYGDMIIRGRPTSSVPSQIAGQLVEKAGIDLSAENEERGGPTAQNRKSGLGALQGFVVGLGIGTAYGLVRPSLGNVSKPRRGGLVSRCDGRQRRPGRRSEHCSPEADGPQRLALRRSPAPRLRSGDGDLLRRPRREQGARVMDPGQKTLKTAKSFFGGKKCSIS